MLVSTLQATNSSNETILHASCRSGSLDLVQFLLEETEIMQLHNLKQVQELLLLFCVKLYSQLYYYFI